MRIFCIVLGSAIIACVLFLVIISFARAITLNDFSTWTCEKFDNSKLPYNFRRIEQMIFIFTNPKNRKPKHVVFMVIPQVKQILAYGYFVRGKFKTFDVNNDKIVLSKKTHAVMYFALISKGRPI